MHQEIHHGVVQRACTDVPASALAALEQCTVALRRPGDACTVCARRDLAPALVLVGLILRGHFVALAIDSVENTALELHDLLMRFLFADAPAAIPTAYDLALEADSRHAGRKAGARRRSSRLDRGGAIGDVRLPRSPRRP